MLSSKLLLITALTLSAGVSSAYFYYKHKFLKRSASSLFVSNEKDIVRNMHINREIRVRNYISRLGPDLPEELGILV